MHPVSEGDGGGHSRTHGHRGLPSALISAVCFQGRRPQFPRDTGSLVLQSEVMALRVGPEITELILVFSKDSPSRTGF